MKRSFALILALCLAFSLTGCGKTPALRTKDCFTVGYAAEAVHVDTERIGDYNVAGYRNDWRSKGVLDDQMVKAVVLDDNSGAGPVVLVSVDCVALSSADVGRIRDSLAGFMRETGCRALHITATHDHAGADTLGLWGPVGVDGKDAEFMRLLREKAAVCVRKAYDARTDGNLFFGYADTASAQIQEDTRYPEVFDSNIYSFRFIPRDSTRRPLRLINYATHAESLDGDNSLISADLPAYVAAVLDEAEGSDMIWFPGAIGGLIRTHFIKTDRVENCRVTAEHIAKEVLSIENEVQLEPEISCVTEHFSVSCDNTLFVAMKFLGVLEQKSHTANGRAWLDTEMSCLTVGGKRILLLPGEIFPELVYGCNTDYYDNSPEAAIPDLCSVFGDDVLVFGLTDDEIGYIVAPDNFLLNEKRPYIDKVTDRFGENHYEETNSCGPETARYLYEAALRLAGKMGE